MYHFLEGAAGSGKTTQAIKQLVGWLELGVNPGNVVVLVPQRALGRPYQLALSALDLPNALDVQVVTFTGLAQRALTLYWSLVAGSVIPGWDGREPTFLTIESAQYYMARFVEPEVQTGYFDSISLDRPRLIAQILNNLSAAAVNRFPLEEVTQRLTTSWAGHSSRLTVYEAAMRVARNFRQHCLENALLDFSLQVEAFTNHLVPESVYQQYARETYRYLIVENAEENFPVTVDFISWLWESLEDAFVVYDWDAGYRIFLGASPDLAYEVKTSCTEAETLTGAHGQTAALANLVDVMDRMFGREELVTYPENPLGAFTLAYQTFYPQMVDWIADQVIALVQEKGVSPREIVVLAPFLGDSLRFSLYNRLELAGVPFVSHRPSRAIRDEPAARAVLTLMKLAYPNWKDLPSRDDVARMFVQFIDGLDPIRAELLAQVVYREKHAELGSFDVINQTMQSRITFVAGERYERLRLWLEAFRAEAPSVPPDHFMRRLFDLVSQDGYSFHVNLDAGRVISQLIESAYHFREVTEYEDVADWGTVAAEYVKLVGDGVLASVHYASWLDEGHDAVFVAPAYTFLMRNRFVDFQFWMDVGSGSWFDRLEQPVTHPYVLRRDYPIGAPWMDADEQAAQNRMLRRLMLGLLRRCRKQVYLGFADLGEQGYEQRGPLLRMFNRVLGVYGEEES